MKKIIFFLILAISIMACKHVEEPEIGFKIDPTAKIYIKPVNTIAATKQLAKASVWHLTPLEIVKKATTMRFYNDILGAGDWAAGFAGKDTVSEVPAFLRYGTDIIAADGFGKPIIVPDFIYAHDIVIEIFRSNNDIDTIAYIPNEVMRKAENDIKQALEAKDTIAVYGIFKDAFKFKPITGGEYKELKAKGLN